MSETLMIALLQFATKFGIDAAIAIGNAFKRPGATIDDAITALQSIRDKSAADYLKEAGGPATPPTP